MLKETDTGWVVLDGYNHIFEGVVTMTVINDIPDIFKKYINQQIVENVEIKELHWDVPAQPLQKPLTRAEASEDFSMFRYLIDNAYSGREYWENAGIDFAHRYAAIQQEIISHETMTIEELLLLYAGSLAGIHDGHLSLWSEKDWYNAQKIWFDKKFKAYFADVLFEKEHEHFVIIGSHVPELPIGDSFSPRQLTGNLFKTLSPTGHEHYLLGCRSWEVIDSLTLESDSGMVTVPIHPCRGSEYQLTDVGIFAKTLRDGVNIVTSSNFSGHKDTEEVRNARLDEIYQCGLSLRDESIVVWNLMGNGGGNSGYPEKFVKGLNDYSEWLGYDAVLNSPPIVYGRAHFRDRPVETITNKREWRWSADSHAREMDKGEFAGTLYVLTNDGVGSSGEAAINFSRSVHNCVVVGQNSGGVGVFGDVLPYQLPFSGIMLVLPFKLFFHGANEGEGFAPDYWVDSSDVLGELLCWLKNPDGYQALKSIQGI